MQLTANLHLWLSNNKLIPYTLKAHAPEKGNVGHADELLEQKAQHQRDGHAEDGAA